MKLALVAASFFMTQAFALDCQTLLLNKIVKEKSVYFQKVIDTYTCGENSCAISYITDKKLIEFMTLDKDVENEDHNTCEKD